MKVKEFVQYLREDYGITEFCGVSDSTLKSLIELLTKEGCYRPFTNEADAVAYAAGCRVANRKVAVLLQNSGITNASSPISSLTALYRIPLVYIVGMRGSTSEMKDEPQHEIIGGNTLQIIQDITEDPVIVTKVRFIGKCTTIRGLRSLESSPSLGPKISQKFFCIQRDAFDPEDSLEAGFSEDTVLKRIDVMEEIFKTATRENKRVKVISTTGFTSRELMKLTEEIPESVSVVNPSDNFYMLGSMGCLAAFAEGLCKSRPDQKFVVLDGDGSVLMHPEGLLHLRDHCEGSCFYIVFDNGVHLSTGGQALPSGMMKYLKQGGVFDFQITSEADLTVLTVLLSDWLKYKDSPRSVFLVVNVSPTAQKDLPRPQMSPEQIYERFSSSLNKDMEDSSN